MSSTFTPLSTFNEGPEKEWSAKLGALDWDNTNIVFTKRSLIEFLKYAGVTLDPNFRNISKIPRYAQIGRMEGGSDAVPPVTAEAPATVSTSQLSAPFNNDYKPSRRVRTVPGGAQTFRFEDAEEESEPVAKKVQSLSIADEKPANTETTDAAPEEESTSNSSYKPSRRVRTAPGGQSSLSNLWSDNPEPEVFKPTRRVRERPGGTDNMTGIF